ncbi:MAG: threonine/serine exporter family protein [Candidatus Cloacimonetes bacterium]|nr:threonine/serine exporter family protein [Candidatus Cloacimonadota bacterium]
MKPNDNSYLTRHSYFLVSLAEALLAAGCSTHRLEDRIERLCIAKGLEGEILIVPTGVQLQLKHRTAHIICFVRVKKLGIKLSLLHNLSDFCDEIVRTGVGTRLAEKQLDKILELPDPYPQSLIIVCFSVVSTFFQFMLGGGVYDCLLCALLGIVVYFSERYFSNAKQASFLSNFVSAFLVSSLCIWYQKVFHIESIQLVILSGIIILTPGLGLTNSIAELSHRQFLSGSARFIEALLVLLFISFGVYLPLQLFGVSL